MTAARKCFDSVIMVFSQRSLIPGINKNMDLINQQNAGEATNDWREVFRNTRCILAPS
jgi:hypothetical protein